MSIDVKTRYAAVGTLFLTISDFAYALLPSRRAPSAVGPKQGMPAAAQASAMPATSGASGPTTTRSAPTVFAQATSASVLLVGTSGRQEATSEIASLPGAHQTRSTSGLFLSAAHSACSRAPPPTTRIFTGLSWL